MLYIINQNKKISPTIWILLLFSLYGIWQMGVVYFSSTSLSLYGRIPIKINAAYTTFFLAGGYIATILLNFFFFKKGVLFGKIVLIIALVGTILLFFPIDPIFIKAFFYTNAFCCSFFIGTNYSVETNLFDNKSELKFVFISALLVFTSVVLIQGDLFNLNFFIFNIISVIILICLVFVFFLLPKNIDTYEKKDKNMPRLLKFGTYLTILVSTLCLVSGMTIAETVTYGVGIFYLSGIFSTLLFGLLIFKRKLSPFKVFTFSTAPTIIGFVFAILSMQFKNCVYPAIILTGLSALPTSMSGFLSNTLFESKPSKIYAPALVFTGFIIAISHSILLDLFRNNLSILFSVISVIAIIMLVTYVSIESSLTYHWHKITLEETDDLIKSEKTTENNNQFEILSNREKQIVDCILQGYTNTEISGILILSLETIKSYRKIIYAKLDIHSRSELFGLANKNN